MLSRHGRPDNDRPDNPDAVAWPDGRWTLGPPDLDGWEPPADDNDSRWGIGPGPDDDGPRPTAGPDPAPDPRDEAYHLGFRLGADGETPVTPPDLDLDGAVAFVAGVLAGVRELDRRVDAMFADRADDGPREYHPDEMIRALGCVAARLG